MLKKSKKHYTTLKDFKFLKNFNGCIFKFINEFRKAYCKDEVFKKFISCQEFAVTIGFSAFKEKYSEIVKKIIK